MGRLKEFHAVMKDTCNSPSFNEMYLEYIELKKEALQIYAKKHKISGVILLRNNGFWIDNKRFMIYTIHDSVFDKCLITNDKINHKNIDFYIECL